MMLAVVVLSVALHPHVYLLARATVSEQAAPTYQAARTLGLDPSTPPVGSC
jgi:ABC-type Fe3+ transport system permease subunit